MLLRVFLPWGTQSPANARVWERWYCCYMWSSACPYSVRCLLPRIVGYAARDPHRQACADVRARAHRHQAMPSFYSAGLHICTCPLRWASRFTFWPKAEAVDSSRKVATPFWPKAEAVVASYHALLGPIHYLSLTV
jgi:hypothetical protein